jgi:mono/diheme cytochrome c family protein
MNTNHRRPGNLVRLGLLLAVLAMGTYCQADSSSANKGATTKSTFELNGNAAEGKALFVQHCAACHGESGKGNGPGGMALKPPPTDFTAKKIDGQRVYTAIKDGGMAVGLAATMPPFKNSMDDQQLRNVAAYVLSLNP